MDKIKNIKHQFIPLDFTASGEVSKNVSCNFEPDVINFTMMGNGVGGADVYVVKTDLMGGNEIIGIINDYIGDSLGYKNIFKIKDKQRFNGSYFFKLFNITNINSIFTTYGGIIILHIEFIKY